MHSLRIISRALPTVSSRCACRTFASHSSLEAPPPAGQAVSARGAFKDDQPTSTTEPSPRPSPGRSKMNEGDARQPQTAEDSLTAFINHMMTKNDRHNQRGRSKSSESSDQLAEVEDLDSFNPVVKRQGDILRNMTRGQRYAETFSAQRGAARLPPLAPPIRLDAYINRAIPVEGGTTLARAFERLNIKLALNKVRQDIRRQAFHERPGLKKKRLKRERWRKRFKDGFVATVKKVRRMRAQGW